MVVGQSLGIGTLYLASAIGSMISLVLRPELVGLLGFAPIAVGLKKLVEVRRGSTLDAAEIPGGPARIATMAAVTIANGGDNLGIYIPLFATRRLTAILIFGLVFAVMTAVWIGLAQWLVTHPKLGAPIRRVGRRLVPFVLIALGLWVLNEAGSLDLFGAARPT